MAMRPGTKAEFRAVRKAAGNLRKEGAFKSVGGDRCEREDSYYQGKVLVAVERYSIFRGVPGERYYFINPDFLK